MRLAGSYNVRKAKHACGYLEHMTVGGDKTFAGQLARPISRDWEARAVALRKSDGGILAIHAAARGIDNSPNIVQPHTFESILGEVSSFPEIHVRLRYRFGNVRISCEVKNRVGTGHHCAKHAEFFDIASHYFEPCILGDFLNNR